MSGLTVLLLCIFGLVGVYLIGYLFPDDSSWLQHLTTRMWARLNMAVLVIVLVGMWWTQDSNNTAVQAVNEAETARMVAQYNSCLNTNEFRSYLRTRNAESVAAAQKTSDDATEALDAATSRPAVNVGDIPGVADLQDPAVREIIDTLYAQGETRNETVIVALQQDADQAQANYDRLSADADKYVRDFPIYDCDAIFPDAADAVGAGSGTELFDNETVLVGGSTTAGFVDSDR